MIRRARQAARSAANYLIVGAAVVWGVCLAVTWIGYDGSERREKN